MSDLKRAQERLHHWMQAVFGDDAEAAADPKERGFRFIEEAVELAQALDFTRDEIVRVVDWVLSRPKGGVSQEVAGTLTTLLSLCNSIEIDAGVEFERELTRVETPEVMARVRSRRAEKNKVLAP